MSHHGRIELLVLVGLVVSSCVLNTGVAAEGDPLPGLRSEHPRLLFTAQDQKRVESLAKTDALLVRLIRQNEVNAVKMLDQAPVRYEIPDGKRLLGQSRKCIQRVAAMAMAYRLTGERRFADGAWKDMRIAAGFKDWNPRHFLDTAEMTTALAIGYDWLYDVLTSEQRATIRNAIKELGLKEGIKVYEGGRWWSRSDSNWNQVCNGGMLMGALAIAEDEPKLARTILTYARKSIPNGVSVYKGSGAYPEGPGYWQYGTSYTAVTISALNTALGQDFDIHKTPGLDQTGLYRIQTIGPIGAYFNYADCGTSSRPASTMFLLSHTFNNPLCAWWHRERLAEMIPAGKSITSRSLDRFFPLEIAWYDPRGQAPTADELPRDACFHSRQDIVTMRSDWGNRDAIYVGFKAGDNRTNHGHLDIGSFVMDSDGVRWALDLGSDDYNMPGYFGRQRWQYYRLTNRSHNTLAINDEIQNPAAKCTVTAFHSTPERVSAIVDMSDAYTGQANSVRRGVELMGRRAVHIRDEIAGAQGTIRWGMVTQADIQLQGSSATLTQHGQRLVARILAPSDAQFETAPTKPPTEREKQNSGTRMLAVSINAKGRERVVISILLQPGGTGPLADTILDQSLDTWPH